MVKQSMHSTRGRPVSGCHRSMRHAPRQFNPDSQVVTVIGPVAFYETVVQNGKQIRVEHIVVSKDGKTLRATIKGTNAQGKPFEQLEVFDKQ